MPTDTENLKLLYTIIEQLDVRSIDWDAVASVLGISNGHAARMRFSRLKHQLDGPTTAGQTKRGAKDGTAASGGYRAAKRVKTKGASVCGEAGVNEKMAAGVKRNASVMKKDGGVVSNKRAEKGDRRVRMLERETFAVEKMAGMRDREGDPDGGVGIKTESLYGAGLCEDGVGHVGSGIRDGRH